MRDSGIHDTPWCVTRAPLPLGRGPSPVSAGIALMTGGIALLELVFMRHAPHGLRWPLACSSCDTCWLCRARVMCVRMGCASAIMHRQPVH